MSKPRKRKGSPFYHYDFTVGGMRFRGSCETDDFETAKTIAASLRREAALNQHLKRKPRLTLDAACAKYWKEHGQHLATSWSVVHPHCNQLIDFFGKSMFIDEIDDAQINRLIGHLQSGTPRPDPATVNRKLDTLSAVLSRAARRWGVEPSPATVSSHKLRVAEARTRWITPAQADKLIAASADHLKPIIRCALLTGLRLSNITGLTWEQVDLDAGIVRVRVKSKLPGRKLLEIPISNEFRRLLDEQANHLVDANKKVGAIFLRRFKGRENKPSVRAAEPLVQVRKSFATACKNAGITDFRFHDLRHTAASWMIQRGVPLDVVQKILGHFHISQTQKYAHRQAADIAAGLNALAMVQNEATKQEAA
jgi:integrase